MNYLKEFIKHTVKLLLENSDEKLKDLTFNFGVRHAVEFMGPNGNENLQHVWQTATDPDLMEKFLEIRTNLWKQYKQTWEQLKNPSDSKVFEYLYAEDILDIADETLRIFTGFLLPQDEIKIKRALKLLNIENSPTLNDREVAKELRQKIQILGKEKLKHLKVQAIRSIVPIVNPTVLKVKE